jgi:FtsZ-binding cell division protein ZapB
LAAQIDERDDIIERLDMELENLRRKNRELFKEQMKGPFKRSVVSNQYQNDSMS